MDKPKYLNLNKEFLELFNKPTIFPIIMSIPQINKAVDLISVLGISPATVSPNVNFLIERGFIIKSKSQKGYNYMLSDLGHKFRYHLGEMMYLYDMATIK